MSYDNINPMLKYLIKTMRPRQWTKNGFLLAALVFDRQLINLDSLLRTLLGFFIFCLLSSTIYLINDLIDMESDKQHPEKCKRPLASGKLSPRVAIIATIGLLVIIFPLAFLLSPWFCLVCAIYFILIFLYSKWLKHIPLIDVMVITSGFVLRVIAGLTIIQVERFSPWLFVVTTLLALLLGFGKRRAELNLLTTGAGSHRKVLDGYTLPFLDQILTIILSALLVSYSLYTFSAPITPENHTMMFSIPFVMYGCFRYLYLVKVKNDGGAPEEMLLKDHPLQISILLWAASIVIILYLVSP